MFVTIETIACNHVGKSGGMVPHGILYSLRVLLRHSEGRFLADLDNFLVMVYSIL